MKLSWNMNEHGTAEIFRVDTHENKLSVADVWRSKNGNGNAREDQLRLVRMFCDSPQMAETLRTILIWCDKNIESKSAIVPFCLELRDLIERQVPNLPIMGE